MEYEADKRNLATAVRCFVVDSSFLSIRTDCDPADSVLCSFPTANISLLKNGKDQVHNPV